MNGTCSAPDCSQRVKARGLCQSHYFRFWRYGDLNVTYPPPPKPSVRLPRRTDAPWCGMCGMTRPNHWVGCRRNRPVSA